MDIPFLSQKDKVVSKYNRVDSIYRWVYSEGNSIDCAGIYTSYNNLKYNYKTIIDEEDLRLACNDDKALNDAKVELVRTAILVSVFWLAFITIMIAFTWNIAVMAGLC